MSSGDRGETALHLSFKISETAVDGREDSVEPPPSGLPNQPGNDRSTQRPALPSYP
jgi:hypothetical protein